jgi:hypothetical protein
MCFTAKDAVEWMGSSFQVPARVSGAVALIFGFSLLRLETTIVRATT